MKLRLKTAPATSMITVNDMKKHLCLDASFKEQDILIGNYIEAAESMMDGGSGFLNRGLITQTWTMTMNDFPRVISLPLPPVQSVTEIRYDDTAGDQQILSNTLYNVSYLDMEHSRARIATIDGASWPVVDDVLGSVEVDFVVGYGTKRSDLPSKVIQLNRFMVSSMFESRETTMESMMDNPVFKSMMNNAKFLEIS